MPDVQAYLGSGEFVVFPPGTKTKLTNTNVVRYTTTENICYPFIPYKSFQLCMAKFFVVEKCWIRVDVWRYSFFNDGCFWMNLCVG